MFFFVLIALLFHSCVEPIHKPFSKIPPGTWRGVLVLDDKAPIIDTDEEFVEKTDFSGELPFTFEVKYTDKETFQLEIHNDDEVIIVDAEDIVYGRDKATAKDTLEFHFPDFDTYISAIFEENIMEGYWHVNYKQGYTIPFKATHGQIHRFSTLKKQPTADLSGKWQVAFEAGTEDELSLIHI